MKITFVKKAYSGPDLMTMGEFIRTSSDKSLHDLTQPFYDWVMQRVQREPTGDVFAVLQRHDLANGDHFFAIGIEMNGESAMIHMVPDTLKIVDEDDDATMRLKARKFDTLTGAFQKRKLHMIFMDEPRRFIGEVRNLEGLEKYINYLHMEQDVKDV